MTKEPATAKPTIFQITIYFDQKGFDAKDAQDFFNEYDNRNWNGSKGIPVKNWRAKALDWMWQKQKYSRYLRSKTRMLMT